MTKIKMFLGFYVAVLLAYFTYSFTQVDLSLTLSKSSLFQQIEKSLQYVGFFQRPISALILFTILLFLFVFYFIFLNLAKQNKLPISQTLNTLVNICWNYRLTEK